MRVGLALPVAPELNRPAMLGALVRAAEGLGFPSLWLSDHLLLPPGDFISHGHQPEALAMLGWLAAATERVGIGTSVLVLPYRDPVVVAKAAGTADWLSGGRVTLGVGAGWLEPEFAALGIPFAQRGARTDAALRAIRACWAEEGGLRARPAGAPGHAIPLLVGGNSRAALRRAAELGDGWQPINLAPGELAAAATGYRAAAPAGRILVRVHPPRCGDRAGGRPAAAERGGRGRPRRPRALRRGRRGGGRDLAAGGGRAGGGAARLGGLRRPRGARLTVRRSRALLAPRRVIAWLVVIPWAACAAVRVLGIERGYPLVQLMAHTPSRRAARAGRRRRRRAAARDQRPCRRAAGRWRSRAPARRPARAPAGAAERPGAAAWRVTSTRRSTMPSGAAWSSAATATPPRPWAPASSRRGRATSLLP